MKKFLLFVALAILMTNPSSQAQASVIPEGEIFKIDAADNLKFQPTSYGVRVMYDIDFLALRTAPNVHSRLLWKIPPGTYLDVYETSNGWLYTVYRGTWGWVSSRYVIYY